MLEAIEGLAKISRRENTGHVPEREVARRAREERFRGLYHPLADIVPDDIHLTQSLTRTIRALWRGKVRSPNQLLATDDLELAHFKRVGPATFEVINLLKEAARNRQQDTIHEDIAQSLVS